MVYFDNLQVSNIHARIIEENHYYAYGLKIAGISSRKLPDPAEGHTSNKDLYNDKELWDEADLNWYDYAFRNYDPQIGRFTQLDPLTDEYPELTPFQYGSCDPIMNVDLDGLEGVSTVGGIWNGAFLAGGSTAAGLGSGVSNIFKIANPVVKVSSIALNLVGQKAVSDGINNGLPSFREQQFNSGFDNTQNAVVSSWCRQCETEADKIGEKAKRKLNNYAIGKDENGNDFAITRLEKNKHFQRFANDAAIPLIVGAITEGVGSKILSSFSKVVLKNGSTAANRLGQDMHRAYKAGDVLEKVRIKEFTLPSGNRIDFIDFEKKIIYELKPNNIRAEKLGFKQLKMYKEEVESIYGTGYKIVLDKY